eukprot:CAMPEP_0115043374 /NCGR_PEP_ID=MMETSP0216-20121206/46831_1 /TAXON_ID=223996 /ORGANISM="Protocruzia adherens, Strain Boccale" /LENGTH=254 /DNA_ID=CAMNT_0002425683 /DNA_START=245 /DNA_END=1009 /DNA_ORIENTATION=+
MITNLETLARLRKLDLSRNMIIKLKGLESLHGLRFLNLAGNEIEKINQIRRIEDLPLLSELDLCFNPVQEKKYYRMQILFKAPHIRLLDGQPATAEEKVKAENLFGLEVEERGKIFKALLPEEEFFDRRILRGDEVDIDSDSDAEDINFIDQYDSKGALIRSRSRSRSGTGASRLGSRTGGSRGSSIASAKKNRQASRSSSRHAKSHTSMNQPTDEGFDPETASRGSRKYVGEILGNMEKYVPESIEIQNMYQS